MSTCNHCDCGARHAEDRAKEIDLLAQVALDHHAMQALRSVLDEKQAGHALLTLGNVIFTKQPGGPGERPVVHVEARDVTWSAYVIGPNVETALISLGVQHARRATR